MAKKPELSQAWWKKHKSVLLKSTGFGAAIKVYTDIKATLAKGGIYDRTLDNFAKADQALKAVETSRKKAEAACGKTTGDSKEILVAYAGVIKAEAAVLSSLKKDYQKFVAEWAARKLDGYRDMPARKKDWTEMKAKVVAAMKTCNASLLSGDTKAKKLSLGLAKSVKKEVEDLDLKTIESCKLWRLQDTNAKPNPDDQPEAVIKEFGVWTDYMAGDYLNMKSQCLDPLNKAIKELA